jgi:hypothetical protein
MTAARIANVRGVPGTLGAIARTLHDGQPVLLSTWHVLFGHGAPDDGEVWLVDDGARQGPAVGHVLYGKLGIVQLEGESYHVDCAVASCRIPPESGSPVRGHDVVHPGDIVTKTGAATGTTTGLVVSVEASESVRIAGRSHDTARQILVRPLDGAAPFSAEGDSGALLVNASGKAVGLLWGATGGGEGIACPIAPVLYAMNITLS